MKEGDGRIGVRIKMGTAQNQARERRPPGRAPHSFKETFIKDGLGLRHPAKCWGYKNLKRTEGFASRKYSILLGGDEQETKELGRAQNVLAEGAWRLGEGQASGKLHPTRLSLGVGRGWPPQHCIYLHFHPGALPSPGAWHTASLSNCPPWKEGTTLLRSNICT